MMAHPSTGPLTPSAAVARPASSLRLAADWAWAAGALLLFAGLSVALGAVPIPLAMVVKALVAALSFRALPAGLPETYTTILYQIRLPHTALIALTGMALAGSGAAYQGLFRNPLADPYVIGVASGAGLGAVVAMALHWPTTLLGAAAIPLAAFVGAMLTVGAVVQIARVGRTTPVTTLILAGVGIGSFMSAATSLIMLTSTDQLHRAIGWMLGGFSLGGWRPVLASLPYLVVGLSLLSLLGGSLNVLQFGDEQAMQLGLDVERVKLVVVVVASLVAATAVAFSGIIGFVGLVVPHIGRLLWGTDYRRLIPLAVLGGGAALLAADILARTVLAPRVIPVGIVTAILGAPFFLWLLRRAKQVWHW